MSTFSVAGIFTDIFNRSLEPGIFHIEEGRIKSFEKNKDVPQQYILPGFIDAHIHIESSMVVPYEFARVAMKHGTIATVSDPHEIANVLGIKGVEYMLENAKGAGLKFCFGAPSCVPATTFESSGAWLDPEAVEQLLRREDIFYLSEMMNYPGVLNRDEEVMRKIKSAHDLGRPVDGHAPGLRGEDARNYIAAGISTDHECFTLEEALDKIQHGMKILIREGSAARNFDALHPLLKTHPDLCMFCCDDKHPDELLLGHIDEHVRRALNLGYDLFDVLRVACINPVEHYKLPVGLLRTGDPADFIIVNNLEDFSVQNMYVNGACMVAENSCLLPDREHLPANNFSSHPKTKEDFAIRKNGKRIRIIEAQDGQLVTKELQDVPHIIQDYVHSDTSRDILKIAVVNRYSNEKPAVAFVRNFGLRQGAIASSVAHDSHNIIAVGADDDALNRAVNLLISQSGGLSLVNGTEELLLPLPVAGLMSDKSCREVGLSYALLDRKAKEMGSGLRAPYMTLSFMALLVIPQLKLSDKGLFDGSSFGYSDLFLED